MLSLSSRLISLPSPPLAACFFLPLLLIFAFSVAMTFIIAFDSIPSMYGRSSSRIGAMAPPRPHPRRKYRTRTGAFEIDDDMRGLYLPLAGDHLAAAAIKMSWRTNLACASRRASSLTLPRVYCTFT